MRLADKLIREICGGITISPFKALLQTSSDTPPDLITHRTHIYNEKVKPAPGVGEIGLEAIGDPFQHHLNDKDKGENFVGKLQDNFDGSSSFDVYIFKGLRKESMEDVHA